MIEAIIKRSNFRDMIFVIIASLAIVSFWRGVWNLLDKFLFPQHFIYSQVLSIIIGVAILIILAEYK